MARIEMAETWQSTAGESEVRATIDEYIAENKMRIKSDEGSTVVAQGGSQLQMRLVGAWLAKPTVLPRRATIAISGRDGGVEISAKIEDTMGVGVMDEKTRGKYDAYFGSFIAGLGERISATG